MQGRIEYEDDQLNVLNTQPASEAVRISLEAAYDTKSRVRSRTVVRTEDENQDCVCITNDSKNQLTAGISKLRQIYSKSIFEVIQHQDLGSASSYRQQWAPACLGVGPQFLGPLAIQVLSACGTLCYLEAGGRWLLLVHIPLQPCCSVAFSNLGADERHLWKPGNSAAAEVWHLKGLSLVKYAVGTNKKYSTVLYALMPKGLFHHSI